MFNNNTIPSFNTINKRKGASGTHILGGRIYEEYAEKLINRKHRYDIYRRMDNDSAVFILRDSINKAKQTAVIDCVPYSEEQKDKEIANFVKKNIMELIQNGRQRMIDDITLYIRDGFSLFERRVEENKNGFYIFQMSRIKAETIEKRETLDGKPGITQRLTTSKKKQIEGDDNVGYTLISIPAEKLILFNINAEGDNYEGVSIYRKMVRDWYYKDKLETLQAILHERIGVPAIKAKVPQGTSNKEEYLNVASSIYSSETGAIIEEYDTDVNGARVPVIEYEVMQNNYTDTHIGESITRYEQNIKDTFYAQFLYLGKSQKGSYGMANTSMEFYMQSISSLIKYDLSIINQYIVPKIVAINFGTIERLPKFELIDIGFVDQSIKIDNIAKAVNTGMITKTQETENYIRQIVELPKIKQEEYGQQQEKTKQEMHIAYQYGGLTKGYQYSNKTINLESIKKNIELSRKYKEDWKRYKHLFDVGKQEASREIGVAIKKTSQETIDSIREHVATCGVNELDAINQGRLAVFTDANIDYYWKETDIGQIIFPGQKANKK